MIKVELDSAIGLFFLAWRGFTAGRDRELGALGLGQVHHRLLFLLARLPDLNVNTLATSLGISRQALHRPLRELLERDLVRSATATHSGRERVHSLTPAGVELENRATASQREVLDAALRLAGPRAALGWQRVMQAMAAGPLDELPSAIAAWLQRPPLRAPSAD